MSYREVHHQKILQELVLFKGYTSFSYRTYVKAIAIEVLTHELRMLYFLEHQSDEPIDRMDSFRSMKLSEEVWNTFKQQTTPAEFATTELIWEIYECQSQTNSDRIKILAKSLGGRIPFNGLDANDISWEALHATLLTVRVNASYHYSNDRHVKLSTISFPHLKPKRIQK